MTKFFVYALVDPRSGTPFYIGKGCGQRPRKHLVESLEQTDNVRKFYKIQALRNEDVEPEIQKLKENLSEEEAFIFEESEILRLGRKDFEPHGILTNLVLGAQPPNHTGAKRSDETKARMSAASKGRKKSPEHCKAIGQAKSGENHPNWGKTLSDDLKEKIRQGNLGVKRSDEARKNIAQAHAVMYEITSPEGKTKRLDSVKLKEFCDVMGMVQGSFVNACRLGHKYKGWSIKKV